MDKIDIQEASKIIGLTGISPQDIEKIRFALQSTRICKTCKSLEANCTSPQLHQLFTVTFDSINTTQNSKVDQRAANALDLTNL